MLHVLTCFPCACLCTCVCGPLCVRQGAEPGRQFVSRPVSVDVECWQPHVRGSACVCCGRVMVVVAVFAGEVAVVRVR